MSGVSAAEFTRDVGPTFFKAVLKHTKEAGFARFPPPGWRYDVVRLVQAAIAGAGAFVDQPKFDASLHAFYYARVLEIPTPRWTLIQAVKAGIPPPDTTPLTGQERAWTTPIWYTPSAEARKQAAAGTTVTDLKAKGKLMRARQPAG